MSPEVLEKLDVVDPLFLFLTESIFKENANFWEKNSPSFEKFSAQLKKPWILADFNPGTEQKILLGLFVNLMVFSFGKNRIPFQIIKNNEKSFSIAFSENEQFAVPEDPQFSIPEKMGLKFLHEILGDRTQPTASQTFEKLSHLFLGGFDRISAEKVFLESLTKSSQDLSVFVSDTKISLDSMLIVMAAMPERHLKEIIAFTAKHLPSEYSFTYDGLEILDVRVYLEQTSTSLRDLLYKVRLLFSLYLRKEQFVDFIVFEKTKEQLLKLFSSPEVISATFENLQKTLFGEYLPLIEVTRPYASFFKN